MSEPDPLQAAMRVRRHQPTRLEGFVDAAFAFAVTLQVISLGHVPASVDEMLVALHGVPTFAVCFLLLVRFWLSHREWGRYYDIDDGASVGLSLALVFLVLIYVYPLRILFAQMFIGFSGGDLSDGTITPLRTTAELRSAYAVFALGQGLIALVFTLLYDHALRRSDQIGLSEAERLFTRMKRAIWIGQFGICALSLLLAFALPMLDRLTLSLPGLAYALNGITGPATRRHYRALLARTGTA